MKLYIVPTPIGNLRDITLRAIDVLNEVDLIVAEDTRRTSILLKNLNITKKLESFHKFNEHSKISQLISFLKAGQKIALVSDAGTPGISDPGFLLIRAAIENNIDVEVLPGPTAFVPALVVSGLPTDKFVFEGFLPVKKGRQKTLNFLSSEHRTMIFYESPFRLIKTLEEFINVFGPNRKCCVCRELTKIHEEIKRGTISEVLEYFKNKNVKGEIVIVVEGNNQKTNSTDE